MTTDREVLAELVALKDLKAQVEALSYGGFLVRITNSSVEWESKRAEWEKLNAEYERRKPLAWAAARARLALPEAVPPSVEQPQDALDALDAAIDRVRTLNEQ